MRSYVYVLLLCLQANVCVRSCYAFEYINRHAPNWTYVHCCTSFVLPQATQARGRDCKRWVVSAPRSGMMGMWSTREIIRISRPITRTSCWPDKHDALAQCSLARSAQCERAHTSLHGWTTCICTIYTYNVSRSLEFPDDRASAESIANAASRKTRKLSCHRVSDRHAAPPTPTPRLTTTNVLIAIIISIIINSPQPREIRKSVQCINTQALRSGDRFVLIIGRLMRKECVRFITFLRPLLRIRKRRLYKIINEMANAIFTRRRRGGNGLTPGTKGKGN